MADIYKMVNEFIVKKQKEMSDDILGEIREIAIENGIRTEIILNEKAITQALLKSQKRKIVFDNMKVKRCPTCFNWEYFCSGKTPNYCPNCGQSLEWEVP